jgi:Uma2 family endonuclease
MGLPKSKPICTVDEYLTLERAAEERHVFLDGEVFAMAGESDAHADVSVNLVVLLGSHLRDEPCRVRTKDTKVRGGPGLVGRTTTQGMLSYPELVAICGEVQHHDEHRDVILNPAVIVEVLSPSTEAFDRGEKFARYQRWNPTLCDHLLVSQDQPQIEHFHRQADGSWNYRRHAGLEASVEIASLQCPLKLAEVYERVAFPSVDDVENPG